MALFGKLLGLWAVGRTVSSTTPLFMRLLMGLAAIFILAAVASILGTLIIGGAFWFGYLHLVAHGFNPQVALIILGSIALAMLISIAIIIKYYLRKIRAIYKKITYAQAPITGRISSITDSFMDGLLSDNPPPRRSHE